MAIALTFLLIFIGVLFMLLATHMLRVGTIRVEGTTVNVVEENEETEETKEICNGERKEKEQAE